MGTVETAVEAMKEGAYDFVTKPLKKHSIVKTVRQALEKQALLQENRQLRAGWPRSDLAAPSASWVRARPST